MKKIITKPIIIITMLVLVLTLVMPMQAQAAGKAKLNKSKVTLYTSGKNKTVTLKVKGTKKKVKWTTSNKKVATVNKSGKVTAKKKGTAVIKAKFGKQTLKCKVTVKKKTATTQNQSKVTVKFNANKGKLIYGKSSYNIQKNKAIKQLPIPLRSCYIFQGWYNGSNQITSTTTFSATTTLTAKWKKTTDDDLNSYMDINYIRTVLHDELVNTPSTEDPDSDLSYDSNNTIKKYMRDTGINKGYQMCNGFSPDYFARQMLSTYGVTFDSYKDAWECALGFVNHRGYDEYIGIIQPNTCEHSNGTWQDSKTCTFDDFVQAVTEEKTVKGLVACSCGELFESGNEWTTHNFMMALQGQTNGHSSTDHGINGINVLEPAYIEHEHRTYCMNTGQVIETNTTTEPWMGGASGMPEDPCNHDWRSVNKGMDNEYMICLKCAERK